MLDFRLTKKSSLGELEQNLQQAMVDGVSYQIVSAGRPVVMDENNPYIRDYKQTAEQYLDRPLEFEYIGGATDSRAFAERGSVVIMHSGSGDGTHAAGEYAVWGNRRTTGRNSEKVSAPSCRKGLIAVTTRQRNTTAAAVAQSRQPHFAAGGIVFQDSRFLRRHKKTGHTRENIIILCTAVNSVQ